MLNNNLYTVINIKKKFWSEFGESLEDDLDASMDNVFRTNFIDIFHIPIRMEFANIGDFLEEAVIYELTNV